MNNILCCVVDENLEWTTVGTIIYECIGANVSIGGYGAVGVIDEAVCLTRRSEGTMPLTGSIPL
jgi:hypothetical protein